MRSFLRDPVLAMKDVLHDGPAPLTSSLDAWHQERARHLCGFGGSYDEVVKGLADTDRHLFDALSRGDEIVLWFEHDLHDQLLLIRALDLIRQRATTSRISLICIDRFPGVDPFYGLGQLDAAQLATLVDTRRPVADAQYGLATRAWAAFRAPDPRELLQLAVQLDGGAALPFLRAALLRFLAQYPSAAHGLSRTETLALTALNGAAAPANALFSSTQREEAQPFMGDWGFYDVLRGLSTARTPLVTIAAPTDDVDLGSTPVEITQAGRAVIEGRQDAVALNGIDRWLGGVHLAGRDCSPWRWDTLRETLVSLDA
jgi:hypothetical protein